MNKNEFISLLNTTSIDEDTKDIEGIPVMVLETTGRFTTNVSQTLYAYGIGFFKREGTKEISYEQWVDTWWNDWEEYCE